MANNFFKNGDKVYSENLNDGVLVGNAFDWTVSIGLPGDTGGVFPNTTTVVKAKVADVYATPNSNLSIGETITNNAGSSQVYRLTVYPNFNRFGGFTFVSLEGDGSVIITEKGGTSPVRNNLDYTNLGNVTELKTLKEYDLVVTIPASGEVTGLSFGFQSSTASANASISQANVDGLTSDLSSLESDLSSLNSNVTQKISNLNTEVWGSNTQTGNSRIDSLNTNYNNLGSRITNLESSVASLDTRVNNFYVGYAKVVQLSSSVWTGGNNLFLFRKGNLVVAFIPSAQLKYTSTGWKDMATLPTGYRPIMNTPLAVINNSTETFSQWKTTNNVLQVYCATANTTAYTGCFGVWITADDYPSQ